MYPPQPPSYSSAPPARPAVVVLVSILLGIIGVCMVVTTLVGHSGRNIGPGDRPVFNVDPALLRNGFTILGAGVLAVVIWVGIGLLKGKRGARIAAYIIVPVSSMVSCAIGGLSLTGQHFDNTAIMVAGIAAVVAIVPLSVAVIILLVVPPARRYLSS